MSSTRPPLEPTISVADFRDFYWLKSELILFCQETGISRHGGKIEIANRILVYLETGDIIREAPPKKPKLPKPTQPIAPETVLGIEQRTYKEKKEFLQSRIGTSFHFTVHLLEYFKTQTGNKTYGDLIDEWYREQAQNRDLDFVKTIAPQFEYNTYIRDFMHDNPGASRRDAIRHWKIKRDQRGDNIYNRDDLK